MSGNAGGTADHPDFSSTTVHSMPKIQSSTGAVVAPQQYIIKVLRGVAHRCPDARVDNVGDGPLKAGLEAMASSYALDGKGAILRRARAGSHQVSAGRAPAFVLPSLTAQSRDREHLPISTLEVMSTDTAVIATRHSGIPEAIPSDAPIFVTEMNAVSGSAEGMKVLLKHSIRAAGTALGRTPRSRQEFTPRQRPQVFYSTRDGVLARRRQLVMDATATSSGSTTDYVMKTGLERAGGHRTDSSIGHRRRQPTRSMRHPMVTGDPTALRPTTVTEDNTLQNSRDRGA